MVERLDIVDGWLFKRYRYRCGYCGATHTVWLWLLKIKLIFTDTVYFYCPVCHHTSCYHHIFNMVRDSTDSVEKSNNRRLLWDERIK